MRSIKNWLANMLGRRMKTQPGLATRLRQRLVLEVLEDRTAPAVLTVNTLSDQIGHSGVSLRDAITSANADAQTGAADTIVFNFGLAGGTIVLSQGQLELSGAPSAGAALITVDASALAGGITIDGNQTSRVLQVDSGVQAELVHVTLQNGYAVGGAKSDEGGGIFNNGTLTINDCIVSANSVSQLLPHSEFPGGGGIFNDSAGMLTVINSTISGNSGLYDGGGILNLGTMSLQGSVVTNNTAEYDGGIANYGTMSITAQSTISFNTAHFAGGIGNYIGNYVGTMVLQNSFVTNNTASIAGGINNDRIPAEITDTVISYNQATGGAGGGFSTTGANVTMTRSEVSHNIAATDAGGILSSAYLYASYNVFDEIHITADAATLALNSCTISDNSAGSSGGGVVSGDGGESSLWNLYRPNDLYPATMTISGSILTGNSAGVNGGALAVFGGDVTISGTTVNGNNTAGQFGGGMFIDPAVVKIIRSTFSGNAAALGADLYNLDSTVTIIASSVVGIYNSGGTVTDPIKVLLAQVAALNLSSGQTNSLTSKLQAAQQSLARANTTAAVNQLNAFINQLKALVNSHRLSGITAGSLFNEVDNLVGFIG